MINVLLLTRYGNRGASSRLRTLQYVADLREHGFDITVHSLLDDDYLAALYENRRRPLLRIAGAYLQRFSKLLQARRFDLVWLEKEALPWLPAVFEHTLDEVPYVVDYDDAIFHRYDQHRRRWVRSLLGRKIDTVMARAHTVVAGSTYLAERAARAGAPHVERIPTSLDLSRYQPNPAPSGPFTVGWIGTPATAPFLLDVRVPLREFHARTGARFHFIGAPADLDLGVPYSAIPWQEATEADELGQLHCGIMPLPDRPFERGKCGYKLVQYMASGKPVLASPVGANNDIVVHGDNGFLCADDEAWLSGLMALAEDPELVRHAGERGRSLAELRFDRRDALGDLSRVLRQASQRPDE